MTKETKRTSSSSRAITTRTGPATQATRTAATRRDPRWRKWEWSPRPLPQADWSWPQTISVPIHMLPTPTLDQAHRSRRAAWDTQLPPSSLHSTLIRPTGTELRWTLSLHCRWAAGRPRAARAPGAGPAGVLCSRSRRPGAECHHFSQTGWWLPSCTCLELALRRKC